MDHNLVFYGIKEYDGENCEDIVKKQVLKQTLEMDQTTVDNIKIDWANRGGKKQAHNNRPVVVKFQDFKTRETIRNLSYQKREALKSKDLGIGVQLPFEIRDRRRKMRSLAQRLQSEGRQVKVVGDKLFVNGKLYRDHQPTPDGATNAPMETQDSQG